MVLRYTSTSMGTLLRGMVATVRASAARPLERAARLRHLIARSSEAAGATASAAASAAHPHAPIALQHSIHQARHFGTSSTSFSPRAVNYGNTSRTFARAGYRPSVRAPRGAAVPATIGLGAARNFATGPAAGSFQQGAHNVPVVLRAFAHILDDDNSPLPRRTRYAPYVPRKARTAGDRRGRGPRALRRSCAEGCSADDSSKSAILRELGHYFPVVIAPTADDVQLPPQPEQLVTPGTTATLALPLAPSLNALLEPAGALPYADAEIGIAVLARLTAGLLPLHDAYAAAGARIIALLARLEALGVLDINAFPTTTLDVAADHRGRPDILRIVFSGRSAQDVRDLLGDMLGDDAWCALSQTRQVIVNVEDEDEATHHWDAPRPASTRAAAPTPPVSMAGTAASIDLVMPTLDLSVAPTIVPASMYRDDFDSGFDSSGFDSNAASWPAWPNDGHERELAPSTGHSSPISSVSGLSTPYSLGDSWVESASPASSLASSLAALDYYYEHGSGSGGEWISPPSEADAEIDAWSDVSASDCPSLVAAADAQHEVEEVEVFWVGGGLSLTQSW